MPELLGVAPVLLVRDVILAAAYWEQKLGFAVGRLWGDPPRFCMPQRDGMIVMLSQAPAGHTITPNWTIVDKIWNAYFWVNDATALHAELEQRGARIDYGLCEQPYGCLEFGIQDLEGHDIAFGQDLDP